MSKHARVSDPRRVWLIRGAACLGAVLAAGTIVSGAAASTPSPTTPPPLRAKAMAGLRPAAIATNVHCGQTLTASVTLNGDLYCGSGTALTLAGSNVVLNLGGHLVGGSGSGYGVTISGKSDTVENGLITEFGLGVYVTGLTDTVSAVRLTYSAGASILDDGNGTKITNCFVAFSGSDGIVAGGANGVYTGNHLVNNGNNGMILEGGNTTVTSTVSNANRGAGINDLGFGAKLTKNTTDYNGFEGVYSHDALLVDGGGNTAKGNAAAYGETMAVQCQGVVCS